METKTDFRPSRDEVDSSIAGYEPSFWRDWVARLKGSVARTDPFQLASFVTIMGFLVPILALVVYLAASQAKQGEDILGLQRDREKVVAELGGLTETVFKGFSAVAVQIKSLGDRTSANEASVGQLKEQAASEAAARQSDRRREQRALDELRVQLAETKKRLAEAESKLPEGDVIGPVGASADAEPAAGADSAALPEAH